MEEGDGMMPSPTRADEFKLGGVQFDSRNEDHRVQFDPRNEDHRVQFDSRNEDHRVRGHVNCKKCSYVIVRKGKGWGLNPPLHTPRNTRKYLLPRI